VASQKRADEVAEVFLGALGGPPRTRDALARIPIARILKAQGAVNRRLASVEELMVFTPTVDGDLIPEPPLNAIRKGATAHIPILSGTTLDEWKLFTAVEGVPSMTERALVERFQTHLSNVTRGAPDAEAAAWQYREAVRSRGGRTSPFEVWSAFNSSRVFHYPSSVLAQTQHAAGGSAFSYLFTWRPPTLRRTLGACHAMDIPFVFGMLRHPLARPFSALAKSARGLSHNMQQAWIQFARTGRPGHAQLPDWEHYTADSRATMVFGRDCYLADAPLETERLLWERWA
jgi:para-nitrobenzyl esterase